MSIVPCAGQIAGRGLINLLLVMHSWEIIQAFRCILILREYHRMLWQAPYVDISNDKLSIKY